MVDPLIPLDEPKDTTPWRVILISALVALVVGAIPTLIGSFVFADNISSQSEQRSADSCAVLSDGRHEANKRTISGYRETQSDITVYQRLLVTIPKGTKSYRIINDGLKVKRHNNRNLTLLPLPNCNVLKQGNGDFTVPKPVPLTKKTLKQFESGRLG